MHDLAGRPGPVSYTHLATHLPGVKLIDKSGANLATKITVRQLIQHRGGLPHQPKNLTEQVEKIVDRLKNDPGLRGEIHAIEAALLR